MQSGARCNEHATCAHGGDAAPTTWPNTTKIEKEEAPAKYDAYCTLWPTEHATAIIFLPAAIRLYRFCLFRLQILACCQTQCMAVNKSARGMMGTRFPNSSILWLPIFVIALHIAGGDWSGARVIRSGLRRLFIFAGGGINGCAAQARIKNSQLKQFCLRGVTRVETVCLRTQATACLDPSCTG